MAFVLEGGMRYDNGDGVNGASAEVGGGLRYTNSGLGLTAEGRGRFVISARDGYEEWGLGGTLMFDPCGPGRGALDPGGRRLTATYTSGVSQLWERGVHDAVGGSDPGHGPQRGTARSPTASAASRGRPTAASTWLRAECVPSRAACATNSARDVGLRLEGTPPGERARRSTPHGGRSRKDQIPIGGRVVQSGIPPNPTQTRSASPGTTSSDLASAPRKPPSVLVRVSNPRAMQLDLHAVDHASIQ